MGFLPDIRRVLRHICRRSGRRCSSARRCRRRSRSCRARCCTTRSTINLERRSAPAVGITQAVYPGAAAAEGGAAAGAAAERRGAATRWCSRGRSIAPIGWRSISPASKVSVERIHGNRSQAQRTEALAGFKSGRYRVLVATDIAARGIDVTALGHVINFDVPAQPDDYIHRVGRTARAELTGSAFTLVVAGGRRRPARHREGDRQAPAARDGARLRLPARARRSASKCRTRSASPRSARARPRSAHARARTPSGARVRRRRPRPAPGSAAGTRAGPAAGRRASATRQGQGPATGVKASGRDRVRRHGQAGRGPRPHGPRPAGRRPSLAAGLADADGEADGEAAEIGLAELLRQPRIADGVRHAAVLRFARRRPATS